MPVDGIKKVGILRGMAGEHYESSLKKGGEIIAHILENLADKWRPVDIFIDKDYVWHCGGVPISPGDLPRRVDLVWNVSHPSLFNVLESFSLPDIGTSGFASLLARNREVLRKHVRGIGLKISRRAIVLPYQKGFSIPSRSISDGDDSVSKYVVKKAKEIFEKFGAPWIVKSFLPDGQGSPNPKGFRAETFPELVRAIEDGVNYQRNVSVEEFIEGRNVSVHSVPMFRGESVYIFSPDNFTAEEKNKLSVLVQDLHYHVGAEHYLQSGFILHPRRGLFLTDIDFSPDLESGSHFTQSCEAVGAKMHHVIDHMLSSALQ